MQLLEEDKPAFKQWLLPKLANRSDAEPEVLADYVAELFGGPGPQEQIKRNSSEQLSDFLGDYTQTFVDEIAAAIENKSWAAKPPATAPTAPKAFAGMRAFAPEAPVFVPRSQAVESASSPNSATSIPTGPRADRLQIPTGPATHGRYNQSNKRKHHDQDRNRPRNNGNEYIAGNPAGERPYKQVARRGGGGGGNGGRSGATGMASSLSSNAAPFTPFAAQIPASLPPLPPMDPSNPFNLVATMSALLGQVYSGQASDTRVPKVKCPNYENMGICKLGNFCPYSHGDAMVVPADPQYDPNMSSLAMPQSGSLQSSNRYQRHGPDRAPFSQAGFSRGADTVVVEPIPEDYFTGQHVRDFFSQFGPIVDVQMHGYKRLAIVKFANHHAAQRAFDSPKVIFDNRFVKVYWHKPGKDTATQSQAPGDVPEIYSEDEDMIDLEEVKKKQALKQAQWQEKRKKAEEVNARYHLLDAQARAKEEAVAELNLRIQAAERAKGVEKIKEKEQRVPASDLAKLQFEAEGLFASQGRYTNGQGSPFRGGYQGRGGPRGGRGGGGRGGVVRLDNRPRRLAVARVGSGSDKELALKQYLLNAKGCNGVQPHAERADTLVVGFEQRYQAEMFLSEALRIANVNSTDLSWIPNDDVVAVQQSTEDDELVESKDELDEEMSDGQMEPKMELDLDVADDTDQWL